jgi:c-di-AMP phosphodiesterase-like protein
MEQPKMNKLYVILFFVIIYILAFSGCSTKKNVTKQREKVDIVQSASSKTLSDVVVDVNHDIVTYRESVITYENNQPVKKTISEKIIDKTKENTKQQSVSTNENKIESSIERTDIKKEKKSNFNLWGMLTLVGIVGIILYLLRGTIKKVFLLTKI